MKGTVNRITDRGFGFISRGDGLKDIIFHSSELIGIDFLDIESGQEVIFEISETEKGPKAVKVKRFIEQANEEQDNEEESDNELTEDEFIGFALIGSNIKVVSLSRDGNYRFIDDEFNFHNLLYLVTSETLTLKHAVEEMESLINNPNTKEKDYQEFFERNPDFILTDDHKKAHGHIILTKDEEDLIPDFVLEPIDQNELCDLLELKLPSSQVFVLKKNRIRFYAAVLEACAQLREYSNFFDEENNRKSIYEKYGLLTYKPKMFVIIGRKGNISPIEARNIKSDLPSLYLKTYDDILSRMRSRVEAMKKGKFKD